MKKQVSRRFKEKNPDYWNKWQKTNAGMKNTKRAKLKKYALTEEEHDRFHRQQNGACAICLKTGGWRNYFATEVVGSAFSLSN